MRMQFITILLLEILVGAEVDLFVPSFPEIQDRFNISPFMVELTVGINLLAYCVGALIVGNLGDKYGRKAMIVKGMIIFVLGSIVCVFATQYWCLLLGRFLQGAGISGAAVLTYVIIADIYDLEEQPRILGIVNGVVTLAMAFAPVIGSYVSLFFTWQGNFAVLFFLGSIGLLFSILFLPNSVPQPNVSINLREYKTLLKSKKAMYYVISISLCITGYWVFVAVAPILYMDSWGVELKYFGLYQGSMTAVFAFFSLSSGYFIGKYGQKNCFLFSIFLLVMFVISATMVVLFDVRNPLIITAIMLLESVGLVLPLNILLPYSLEAVKNTKSRMSALIVSVRLMLTAFFVQFVSYFYDGTFVLLGATMVVTMGISIAIYYKLIKIEKKILYP